MARGVNKVILIGNLGADPDTRYTPSGSAVANLSLATDESYKDRQTGQLVPRTEWHRIVIFGKLAEIAQQYLKKGSKVYIEGRLQTRKWQDQSGQDRYTTEIVVDIQGQMQMLDSRGGMDQQGGGMPSDDGWGQSSPPQQGGGYGGGAGGGAPGGGYGQPKPQPQSQPQSTPQSVDDFDDDIPF